MVVITVICASVRSVPTYLSIADPTAP
jgi:hypothetical protein